MADHSEARERAQFEQCQAEFSKIADENDLHGMSRLLGGVYFTHGWCAGRRSLEQERWVSVEERLPEKGQAVLVWFGELDSNAYMDVWTYRGDNQYFRASTKRTRDDVTHWMPTPAPPVHKGDS